MKDDDSRLKQDLDLYYARLIAVNSDIFALVYLKAAYSVTFDLLILKIMFLFFKNTVKILKFR